MTPCPVYKPRRPRRRRPALPSSWWRTWTTVPPLQLGIGSLPNAVGQMLAQSDLRDLGIHTEMLCDCYLDMYRAGKITNKRKDIDRYKSVFGFAIGSEDLYDWVRENPGVVTYPISYCNAPSTVRNIENFVSINNCISVDLYGQICAESAGTRQISGTGGQLDFLEGAAVSPAARPSSV